jgi:hypothetical protein
MNKKQEDILKREKKIFETLHQSIEKISSNKEDLKYIQDTIEQLDQLFLITIVGEFNSGKSSFINALLGDKYMKDGIIPTTTTIHMVKYGETFKEEYNSLFNQHTVEIPLYWLKGLMLGNFLLLLLQWTLLVRMPSLENINPLQRNIFQGVILFSSLLLVKDHSLNQKKSLWRILNSGERILLLF